jgi:hypothetical protein
MFFILYYFVCIFFLKNPSFHFTFLLSRLFLCLFFFSPLRLCVLIFKITARDVVWCFQLLLYAAIFKFFKEKFWWRKFKRNKKTAETLEADCGKVLLELNLWWIWCCLIFVERKNENKNLIFAQETACEEKWAKLV